MTSERKGARVRSRPTLWCFGGMDPSGGAGLLRDGWTARATAPELDVTMVLSAFTWQGQGGTARVQPVSGERLLLCSAVLPAPAAIKLGLIPSVLVDDVRRVLSGRTVPIVLDPVLEASDGGGLGAQPDTLVRLAAAVTLLTPNLTEAQRLTGIDGAAPELLAALVTMLPGISILLKGGHDADAARVTDRLWHHGKEHVFIRARAAQDDVRGTGCALATAIACKLAYGHDLVQAVDHAIAWLDQTRVLARPGPDGRLHLPPTV